MADQGDDLIGFEFKAEDGLTYRVTHHWANLPGSVPGYMLCTAGTGSDIIRPIHALRQRKLATD